ncbi:hypothetical protein [Paenibacillus soyae]|uniref:Uncharacterized protein n=1 Tax=Paenibacillus soyae TaxID=2969249 RepID=A0A9X2MML4_9BACL|nr:hypothetical protein [Paenibacillus soyae]MCR2802518.1 hypothetical protein [Paenibacillus soyae]
MKKILIVLLAFIIAATTAYFTWSFNDEKLMDIRINYEGDSPSVYVLSLSQSGKLKVFLGQGGHRGYYRDRWLEEVHQKEEVMIPEEDLKMIKTKANQAFWQDWFISDGSWKADVDGNAYFTVLINGKRYRSFDHTHTNSEVFELIQIIKEFSPMHIGADEIYNFL